MEKNNDLDELEVQPYEGPSDALGPQALGEDGNQDDEVTPDA